MLALALLSGFLVNRGVASLEDGHVARRLTTAGWTPSQDIEPLVDGSSSGGSSACPFGGIVFNGISADDYSGFTVTSAGDVNNDGYGDILIGAFGADPGGRSEAGATYLVFGSPTIDADLDGTFELSTLPSGNGSLGIVFNGDDADDWSGRTLAAAGDVNADGYDDILIGAYQANPNGRNNAGSTYLVFGSATMGTDLGPTFELSSLASGDGSLGIVLNGRKAADNAGRSVSSAGDVNGDGITDMLISANWADPNGSRSGETYLIFGSTTISTDLGVVFDLSTLGPAGGTLGVVFNGIDAHDSSGFSISSAGDVNGDTFADILIAAHWADPNGDDSGETYLIFGSATIGADSSGVFELSALAPAGGSLGVVFNGIAANDLTGFSVSTAGDVNRDGYDDILIGARGGSPDGRTGAGRTYLIFGNATVGADLGGTFELSALLSGDGSIGVVFNGVGASDRAGRRVASAGDVNSDGYADILIGAYLAEPADKRDAGATYLIYGSATMGADLGGSFELSTLASGAGLLGVVFNGVDTVDNSGRSVSSAGDVNGDGTDDILIGAWVADPNGVDSAGETYLLYGIPTTCSLIATYVFDGNADDSSGNGFNCTLEGGSFGPDRHGVAASAYVLDGVDDYVTCPDAVTTDILGDTPRTICAWARNDDPDSGGAVFQYGGSGECSYFSIRLAGSDDGIDLIGDWLVWTNGQDEGCNLLFEDLLTEDPAVWHQHCLVYEGPATLRMNYYVDGVLIDDYEPGASSEFVLDTGDARPLEFGRWSGGDHFTGSIDDVSVWCRALSATQIAELYTTSPGSPTTPGPTSAPSQTPTTTVPSIAPSPSPTTVIPSAQPSATPTTPEPTSYPTFTPTTPGPTSLPSFSPTTPEPTSYPTFSPTTPGPTSLPSFAPTTPVPSAIPSESPTTPGPTSLPTFAPTTPIPTAIPSESPTTSGPTSFPTSAPTTPVPTAYPTTPSPTPEPSSVPTRSPLIASYAFDGDAVDGSGNGLDCSLRGLGSFGPDRHGHALSAYVLDGDNDYVVCPDAVIEDILADSPRTICAWAINDDPDTGGAVFNYGGRGTCAYYSIRLVGPTDGVGTLGDWLLWSNGQSSGCNLFISNVTIEERTGWHQHCLVYEGGATNVMNYYLDGSLRDGFMPGSISDTDFLTGDFWPLEFGRWFTQDYFTGAIDDASVWRRALSALEIEELYWSQATVSPTTAAPSTAAPSAAPTTPGPTGVPTVPPTKADCPPNYNLVEYDGNSTCYRVTSLSTPSWFECFYVCTTIEMATMLCVTSEAQNSAVRTQLSEEVASIWLGYEDNNKDDVFEWVDGCESNYTNWRDGDPDRFPGRGFAFVTAEGDWRDRNFAGSNYACVCETAPLL